MNSSTETKEVMAALHKAIGNLPNPHNDARNPHFKSRYLTLSSALTWVKTMLAPEGIRLSQPTLSRDGLVGCVTRFTHKSGQWVEEGELLFPYRGDDPQKAASALTYARRYSLLAACGIASTDDDDDGNYAAAKPQPKQPKGPTADQANVAAGLKDYMEQSANMEELGTVWVQANKDFAEGKITHRQMDDLTAVKDKCKKGFES